MTHWGAVQAILNWLGKTADKHLPEAFDQWLNQATEEARQRLEANPEYWDSLVDPNCLLALMTGALDTEQSHRIIEGYRSAAERGDRGPRSWMSPSWFIVGIMLNGKLEHFFELVLNIQTIRCRRLYSATKNSITL